MAEHDVWVHSPSRKLGSADIQFKIYKDGALFGTLGISKGALVWYPNNAKRGHKVGWQALHDVATERRKSERRRRR